MKRDKNLYPLSWQHHNGLMAVLLLKKGLKKQADIHIMGDFIIHLQKDELAEHFEAEETTLIQLSVKYPALVNLFEKMKQEHLLINNCIQQMSSPSYEMINTFCNLLDQHIHFEERELFPLIEQTISPEDLQETGKALHHLHHQACANYPVKFWE